MTLIEPIIKNNQVEDDNNHENGNKNVVLVSSAPPPSFAGRDTDKDTIRRIIWDRLGVEYRLTIGITHDCIPNFVGADTAAWRLSQTKAWKTARTIKAQRIAS